MRTSELKLTQINPRPGTHRGRSQRVPFNIDVEYSLLSADSPILSISTAQHWASRGGCQGDQEELVDAIQVPIPRGKHQLRTSTTWSGDIGVASYGRIYQQGFLLSCLSGRAITALEETESRPSEQIRAIIILSRHDTVRARRLCHNCACAYQKLGTGLNWLN